MSCGQHEPERRCTACRQIRSKAELLRVVCPKDGEPELDMTGKLPGRGAYICPSEECVEKALKKGSLARALRRQLPESLAEQLRNAAGGRGNA